ncbi:MULTISPECIES: serine/threonine-protein kinase [Thermomonospora]|uniref:non-specific serine/threonine protein kinase n=1 Tax=Thermomonospora curvata (strain ATCC 19995 / DSM 43183 / JCM 3096 / KCTC 9072 / NBRC 15933 / NCIMB 10081 / Henssen B9) TaxID=471852 RepID=D1AEH0_THECD|nr:MULTISPECIES: serine/threonine-protein kinase [Thermomonospora]ACY95786.1 serine/threonine protein kinase [Thermomonospora curvata DSM 43183]PKK16357.1 MAG: serine/threonine protein kinase [Thermomonospora sp. CIF 1]
MEKCTRPGCPGYIEDGFCNVDGLAPEPVPAQPTAVSGAPGGQPAPPTRPSVPAPSQPSGASGATGSGRTASGRSARTGGTASTGSSRRGMLGAGLVEVPPVPYRDPATAIMRNPEVPENRRFCSVDGEPVGRSRDGRPGRTEGYCRKCGHPFSFTPKLRPGDLVGGQYEVLGCLAFGGMGWIYLARDKNVSDSWRVLKGLLDSGDADAMRAATAERAFLAQVDHPNIVKIYNFVQHPDPHTKQPVGYIVMEYVGGKSLKEIVTQLRREHGEEASLPLPQVIAYGLEVLRAMGYLHSRGLLYCDFKPDNAIQSEEQLKLIDLGGVRRIDDEDSPIFGTIGYQAPEVPTDGPSISSDLYTVGRTLAVLSFPFRGYTGRYAHSLPPREEVPLLMRHESFYRFLCRATHPDPRARFQDAAEMAEQLTGVLREVLAAEDGRPRPAPSTLFGTEQQAAGATLLEPADEAGSGQSAVLPALDVRAATAALPVPQVSPADPAAGFLSGLTARDPADLEAALAYSPVSSPEVSLMLVRARIGQGKLGEAVELLDRLAAERPEDWRLDWYRGLAALAADDRATAVAIFDDLCNLMPGEKPPKLALAFAHERNGNLPAAVLYYDLVARTDPGYVSAAFGAARVRLALGDRAGAVAVLDSVPRVSSHHAAAQLAAVAAVVRGRPPAELNPAELVAVGRRLEALQLDAERYQRAAAEVLEAALSWTLAHRSSAGQGAPQVLGVPLQEGPLRRRLEKLYRGLARLSDDVETRHRLVNRANRVRPRTLL